MSKLTPFHVAVPVYDLEESGKFYREVLGCSEGRSSDQWTDFNLYGHQFVIHLSPGLPEKLSIILIRLTDMMFLYRIMVLF